MPEPDRRKDVQSRIERVLAPYEDRIESFEIRAPADQDYLNLVVKWRASRPDTIISIHDKTDPHWEDKIIPLLNP